MAKAKIFISHSTKDAAFVALLSQSLKQAGVDTFVARTDAEAGKQLWPQIAQAILHSNLVIGVYTPSAAASSFVNQELSWAVANRKQLVVLAETRGDLIGVLEGRKYIKYRAEQPEETIRVTIDTIMQKLKSSKGRRK